MSRDNRFNQLEREVRVPARSWRDLCGLMAAASIGLWFVSWPVWAAPESEDAVLQSAYPYVVVEQDLKEVLRELRRNLGIPAVISDKVGGVVRAGAQHDGTVATFMHRLAAAHDLVWYLDKGTLFVTTQQESVTQWLEAAHLGAQRRAEIAKLWSQKGEGVSVTVDDASRSLIVTGPAEFRERVASVISTKPSPPAARGSGMGVTVFRGASGGQHVVVPR